MAAGITLAAIGHVEHDVSDADVSARRRDLVCDIVLEPQYASGLDGIADYSHLIVLFWMDRAQRSGAAPRVRPRGRDDLPPVGVFASRGRDHPNAIGLAVVELIEHAGARLRVRRLDAYAGTPVLDIKPFDRYDLPHELRVPAWWDKMTVPRVTRD